MSVVRAMRYPRSTFILRIPIRLCNLLIDWRPGSLLISGFAPHSVDKESQAAPRDHVCNHMLFSPSSRLPARHVGTSQLVSGTVSDADLGAIKQIAENQDLGFRTVSSLLS